MKIVVIALLFLLCTGCSETLKDGKQAVIKKGMTGMKRTETIKDQKLFNNIIRNGKFIKNNFFVIYNIRKEEEQIYYGIAISNKVGNAVTRNKLKRQTRAIIDNHRNLFKNAHNYIIMIRKGSTGVDYQTLERALVELLEK